MGMPSADEERSKTEWLSMKMLEIIPSPHSPGASAARSSTGTVSGTGSGGAAAMGSQLSRTGQRFEMCCKTPTAFGTLVH